MPLRPRSDRRVAGHGAVRFHGGVQRVLVPRAAAHRSRGADEGDVQEFQEALDGAVLAMLAVQGDVGHVRPLAAQRGNQVGRGVKRHCLVAGLFQRRTHLLAAGQRKLSLERRAAISTATLSPMSLPFNKSGARPHPALCLQHQQPRRHWRQRFHPLPPTAPRSHQRQRGFPQCPRFVGGAGSAYFRYASLRHRAKIGCCGKPQRRLGRRSAERRRRGGKPQRRQVPPAGKLVEPQWRRVDKRTIQLQAVVDDVRQTLDGLGEVFGAFEIDIRIGSSCRSCRREEPVARGCTSRRARAPPKAWSRCPRSWAASPTRRRPPSGRVHEASAGKYSSSAASMASRRSR